MVARVLVDERGLGGDRDRLLDAGDAEGRVGGRLLRELDVRAVRVAVLHAGEGELHRVVARRQRGQVGTRRRPR